MDYLNKKYQKLLKHIHYQKEFSAILQYFLIFLVTACFFFYLTNSAVLTDPDAFYHAKISLFLSEKGIIKDFPWFQATILKDYFTDHQLLYHLFLIPFVNFFPPLWGVKLSVIIFAGLLAVVFTWFLRKFQIRWPLFYWLFFLTSSPFIFRIALVKTNVWSLIFLLLGLYFIFCQKPSLLFILSFLYVWLYGGWLLMLVLVGFHSFSVLIETLLQKISKKKLREKIKINFLTNLFFTPSKKMSQVIFFLACLSGLLGGIIINPYFPRNLVFYWYQIIKVGIVNYQSVIGVGAEWYPYNLLDLIGSMPQVFILLLVAIFSFFLNFLRQERKTISLFFLCLFFLFLTLKSRRYVEYFVPFAILFSAFEVNSSLKNKNFKDFYFFFWDSKVIRFLSILAAILFLFLFSSSAYQGVKNNKEILSRGTPFDYFERVSQFLISSTPKGSIIFHDNWDSSLYLFYHNTHNYYLVGLDPTFMYFYDKDLYWQWVNITTGKQEKNLKKTIQEKFRANYVLVDKNHKFMENNLIISGDFKLIYQDEEARIYEVNPHTLHHLYLP